MDQRLSWEYESSSDIQKIPNILWPTVPLYFALAISSTRWIISYLDTGWRCLRKLFQAFERERDLSSKQNKLHCSSITAISHTILKLFPALTTLHVLSELPLRALNFNHTLYLWVANDSCKHSGCFPSLLNKWYRYSMFDKGENCQP